MRVGHFRSRMTENESKLSFATNPQPTTLFGVHKDRDSIQNLFNKHQTRLSASTSSMSAQMEPANYIYSKMDSQRYCGIIRLMIENLKQPFSNEDFLLVHDSLLLGPREQRSRGNECFSREVANYLRFLSVHYFCDTIFFRYFIAVKRVPGLIFLFRNSANKRVNITSELSSFRSQFDIEN